MSQRAPDYRSQYQVPPTSPASSSTTELKPALRNRCRRYKPANPAPTTATSTCCVAVPRVASDADDATIASGIPPSHVLILPRSIAAHPSLSPGQQFHLRGHAIASRYSAASASDPQVPVNQGDGTGLIPANAAGRSEHSAYQFAKWGATFLPSA